MSQAKSVSEVRLSVVPNSVLKAWRRANARARGKGSPHALSPGDLEVLWQRCEGCCAVSGLPFSEERFPNALVKQPFAPSIDQIEATKGYTLENARITCIAANFGMNQWGLGTLRRLAHAVVIHEERETSDERAWFNRQNEKLREAEQLALSLTGEDLTGQRRRIAGLKRAITMGPVKLSGAATKANRTISRARTREGADGLQPDAEAPLFKFPPEEVAKLKADIDLGE